MNTAVETFAALDRIRGLNAAFIGRIPGVDTSTDRETALARLRPHHEAIRVARGFSRPATAEQVHGNVIAVGAPGGQPAPGADALITDAPGVCLGIYVADCAAVYLADRRARAIGLVHSGRKGTELAIVPKAVQALESHYGVAPGDLCAVISPCIRPPHYEVDFAAEIRKQLEVAGVIEVVDPLICTASEPTRYYSYRREQGLTGRMLALLELSGVLA